MDLSLRISNIRNDAGGVRLMHFGSLRSAPSTTVAEINKGYWNISNNPLLARLPLTAHRSSFPGRMRSRAALGQFCSQPASSGTKVNCWGSGRWKSSPPVWLFLFPLLLHEVIFICCFPSSSAVNHWPLEFTFDQWNTLINTPLVNLDWRMLRASSATKKKGINWFSWSEWETSSTL